MEMEEREERKRMQELREQERRQEEERERLLEQKQVTHTHLSKCFLLVCSYEEMLRFCTGLCSGG